MVGDIKQSIYRFREARPELFLEKYKNYLPTGLSMETVPIDNSNKNVNKNKIRDKLSIRTVSIDNPKFQPIGRKIKLFKNFRSREEVLNLTNWVFKNIMSEKLGDVDYTEEEFLNLGASYDNEEQDLLPELHILDLKEDEASDIWKQDERENVLEEKIDEGENEEQGETQFFEKSVEEAKIVANRIEELFKQNFIVQDRKKGRRKIEYKDIVILLRSTTNIAPIYEKELTARNFPVFCDTSSEYLEASEIQTILALLKIIDNPMQDIPLVQVLRSPIAGFTDNELVEIRLSESNGYFYEAMLKSRISVKEDLRAKI